MWAVDDGQDRNLFLGSPIRVYFHELGLLRIPKTKGQEMETISSRDELDKNIDKSVTLSGTALDAKAGAVIKIEDGLVYMNDLTAWPPEVIGNQVIAAGKLIRQKFLLDPVTSPSGLTPQGAFGDQFVLEKPSWRLAGKAK